MTPRYRPASLLAVALLAGSCASPFEPDSLSRRSTVRGAAVAPEPGANGRHYYPLDLGNRWQYARRFRTQFFPRGLPPRPLLDAHSRVERGLDCLEGPYTIETSTEVIETEQGPQTTRTWARFRQDGDGLFQAAVPLDAPPSCLGEPDFENLARETILARWLETRTEVGHDPSVRSELARVERCLALARGMTASMPVPDGTAQVRPGEITILAYPLHPLQVWEVRGFPPAIAWVEAIEFLELAGQRFATQRIRIHIPGLMSGDDRLIAWVSRSGFVMHQARFLQPVILNREVGNLLTLESEVLDSLELASGLP